MVQIDADSAQAVFSGVSILLGLLTIGRLEFINARLQRQLQALVWQYERHTENLKSLLELLRNLYAAIFTIWHGQWGANAALSDEQLVRYSAVRISYLQAEALAVVIADAALVEAMRTLWNSLPNTEDRRPIQPEEQKQFEENMGVVFNRIYALIKEAAEAEAKRLQTKSRRR